MPHQLRAAEFLLITGKSPFQPLHTHQALWILLEQWLHQWVLLPTVILQPLQMNLASEMTLAVPPSDRHPLMAHTILALVNPRQASPTRTRQIPLPTASQRPHNWDGTLKSEQALVPLELAWPRRMMEAGNSQASNPVFNRVVSSRQRIFDGYTLTDFHFSAHEHHCR